MFYKVKRNTAAIMEAVGDNIFHVKRGPQKREGYWNSKKLRNHWLGKQEVPEHSRPLRIGTGELRILLRTEIQ